MKLYIVLDWFRLYVVFWAGGSSDAYGQLDRSEVFRQCVIVLLVCLATRSSVDVLLRLCVSHHNLHVHWVHPKCTVFMSGTLPKMWRREFAVPTGLAIDN